MKHKNDGMIVEWVVQYDQNGDLPMPICLQGICVNDNKSNKIMIDDIFILDFKNHLLQTTGGKKYLLSGPGQRIVLFDEIAAQNYENGVLSNEEIIFDA